MCMPDAMQEVVQQLVEDLLCCLLHDLAPIEEILQNETNERVGLIYLIFSTVGGEMRKLSR